MRNVITQAINTPKRFIRIILHSIELYQAILLLFMCFKRFVNLMVKITYSSFCSIEYRRCNKYRSHVHLLERPCCDQYWPQMLIMVEIWALGRILFKLDVFIWLSSQLMFDLFSCYHSNCFALLFRLKQYAFVSSHCVWPKTVFRQCFASAKRR